MSHMMATMITVIRYTKVSPVRPHEQLKLLSGFKFIIGLDQCILIKNYTLVYLNKILNSQSIDIYVVDI